VAPAREAVASNEYHLLFSISFQASSLKRRQAFFVHVYRQVWQRERMVYNLFNSWILESD
jgi:hypothetical protein